MPDQQISIRSCHTNQEFEQMVELESQVWGFGERELVPSQMYVVAAKIGGQVLAAFVGSKIVGFVLAYPGIRQGEPYLHSHMAAVLPEFQDLGIGRKLKLAQREDALARGISLIEWTFDPLQAKNAYFNICRLGVVARRYVPDLYGSTTSPLHAGLPTDRLVAEWHLASERVAEVLGGKQPAVGNAVERVHMALDESSPRSFADQQTKVRGRFQELFAEGYKVTWFERHAGGDAYVLEPVELSGT
jgi:predicted GNAT superfamily acetyltransferase